MAPRHVLAALLFNAVTASAASVYWTYTSRYADQVTASPYTRYNSQVTTYTSTTTRRVKDNAPTATVTPTSTSTYLQTYDNLLLVYAYYPTGVFAESDLIPARTYDASATYTAPTTYTWISFSMPVTMTPPASCPTQFTVTTTASVSIPTEVTAQVTPTSTKVGTTSTALYGDVYEYQTWYLSASAVPFVTTSNFDYRYYIASCSTPYAAYTTGAYTTGARSGGGGGSTDSNSSSDYCYYSSYYCGSALRTWIIIVACIIPALFLLGFLESWFWFRRLMLGKSAMRFGTVCWVLISLWVLCFTRMQDKRSPEDQKLLLEKWKNMGSGAAFKAWWKWGFRHKYPEEHLGQFSRTTVGIVPTGQPLYPAMAQTQPGFPPGGPGAPPPGALQPVPGQPGQVFYYGPPPPGWVPGPNGGFAPPQGYVYPPPQQGAYYGDSAKDGSLVSHSPISALNANHSTVSPLTPQAPQPVYPTQAYAHNDPSPPPQGPVPTPPQAPVSPAPQLPPVHVSEAPSSQAPRPPVNPPHPGAARAKNDPHDNSLYESTA